MTRLRLPNKEDMEFARNYECSPQLYYSRIFGPLYQKKLKMLLDFLPNHTVGSILEIGYGAGIGLKELSSRAGHVDAIDIHELSSYVKTMLAKERITNTQLYKHDIFKEPLVLKNQVDYAFSSSVFEHLPPALLEAGIANVAKAVKSGGYFLIGFPLKTSLMNLLFKIYEFTYKQFNNIYNFSLEHDHPSGQDEIIPRLEKYFRIEDKKYFVHQLIPLYIVLKCKKR